MDNIRVKKTMSARMEKIQKSINEFVWTSIDDAHCTNNSHLKAYYA